MKIEGLLKNLKQEIIRIVDTKVEGLILFGSYARGEEKKFSDVDLLLLVKEDLTKDEKYVLDKIISKFSLDNDIVISCIDYPAEIFEKYNTPFLLNVKEEGVRI